MCGSTETVFTSTQRFIRGSVKQTFTLVCSEEAARLSVSGHLDVVVHALQDLLVQLDLSV